MVEVATSSLTKIRRANRVFFGTLVVCLPLAFGGGRLVVEQQARATFDWKARSYFGSSPEEEAGRIRWAAFFGDVDHRIETVTSGCTSCSPAKKVVMRTLVSGVRQTTRCGPNLFSLTQRLSAKLW